MSEPEYVYAAYVSFEGRVEVERAKVEKRTRDQVFLERSWAAFGYRTRVPATDAYGSPEEAVAATHVSQAERREGYQKAIERIDHAMAHPPTLSWEAGS